MDITITLTDEELQAARDSEAGIFVPGGSKEFDPTAFVATTVKGRIAPFLQTRTDARKRETGDAYEKTTPEDKAAIDAVLEKYRTKEATKEDERVEVKRSH